MDTFDVLQLAALALFAAILGARSVLMLAREGRSPFALGAGKRGMARALEAAMPVFMAAWAAALLVSTIGSRGDLPALLGERVIDAGWARGAGAAVLFGSVGLFTWALVSFGSSWRVGIDRELPGALVTEGVFSYTRNPIFLAMDAFFTGTFLVQGTAFFLAAALIAIVGTHAQILQEEEFLARRYGEAYRRYSAMVPRYIGLKKEARTVKAS